MWIFLSDALLSIVAIDGRDDEVLVRARFRDDLEAVFPEAEVVEGGGSDYRYRARVPREVAIEAIGERLAAIDYPNFKDSIAEPWRHDLCFDLWQRSFVEQERRRRAERGRR